jgi:hypothetical protein
MLLQVPHRQRGRAPSRVPTWPVALSWHWRTGPSMRTEVSSGLWLGTSVLVVHGGTSSCTDVHRTLVRRVHRDPRSGCDKRPSQGSDNLLSVPDVCIRHHMQHARNALGLTPVTGAPHLNRRSLYGDPGLLRARRPVIMKLPLPLSAEAALPIQVISYAAGLSAAPEGISPCSR